MTRRTPEPGIDARLHYQLRAVATRVRAQRLHRRSARIWFGLVLVALVWIAISGRFDALKSSSFPVLAVAVLVVGWMIARWWRQTPLDYAAAADLVERDHPDLQQALRTALEQRPAGPDGTFHFLQRHVIDRALLHAATHSWSNSRRHVKPWSALAHAGALVALTVALAFSIRPPTAILVALIPPPRETGAITITPGNTEIERGSTVVIAARFAGDLPRNATLVWTPADGLPQRTPMARSLSDPVFAHTLPRVEKDVDYQVEYDDAESGGFRLNVFDRPALLRADAALDYPEYTGLADRRIEDTRRLSAVEGTKVDYEFLFNKPIQSAILRTVDGDDVPLVATNPERTRYALAFTVAESVRYTLHLEDDAARTNPAPPDIRIEALTNRRPDLKIAFPRGDQRVSALEEVQLQGEARDDFGLLDYGVAVAVGANEPEYFSLLAPGEKTTTTRFARALTLEQYGVQPDDLVTWFAWADDVGVDGAPRRTASDPFFGEVRPFDEIFREQREGASGGEPQGQSGPDGELLELQRQISISIWKLRQQDPPGATLGDDVKILATSQAQARTMLGQVAEMIRDPQMMSAATDAGRFMDRAYDALNEGARTATLAPLAGAWSAAQGAYQALLRMQARETNVSQSRNGQGSGGARNQRQLDQLKFRDNEDNYETESQAQSMTTPEERERLETLARLKDLARRQQDVNERLQQMQTALQEAQDQEERERIQRELKRLEEEQRRMLSELDDVRQHLDRQPPSESATDAREQLDETRESMRQAGESIEKGDVSQALAEGTRARENLEEVGDDLRQQSANRFSEQLREARREARELAENQQRTAEELQNFDTSGPRRLDSSDARAEIAQRIEQQRADHEGLVESLRQITEDAEVSEPGLHRQLYDLMREHGQNGADNRMEAGAELTRRGLLEQASELQPGITRDLEELRRGVERAAESILGDETSTLRFAQNELEELNRELEQERGEAQPGAEGETGGNEPGRDGAGREQAQDGSQPGSGGQPPGEPRPGTGERTDEPGTGASGIAQGERPGTQPGSGGSGREPREGETPRQGAPGQEPGGEAPTVAGQGEAPAAPGAQPGQATGSQPGGTGTDPGEGETPELAQGQSPGQQPGQAPGTQPGESGQPSGQTPGQGGRGQSPGQGEGQGEGTGERPQGASGSGTSPGSRPGRGGGGGAGDPSVEELARALESMSREGRGGPGGGETGPITGENFTEWEERLRTVEALLDSPEARARLAAARERAEAMRAEFRRHGTPPQWGTVEAGISAPLSEVRTWLRQELARRADPTTLQPVDRDPVPERFEENVRKYYEALGE